MVTTVENDDALQERTAGFIPNDDYTAALSALLREGSWYFSGSGMVIFSSLYEISSYAAGIIQFEIPYSELAGHIDEKWIPAETTGEGGFEIVSAADMKDGAPKFSISSLSIKTARSCTLSRTDWSETSAYAPLTTATPSMRRASCGTAAS